MSSPPRIPPKNVPTLTQVVTPGQIPPLVAKPPSAQNTPKIPPKAPPTTPPGKLVERDPLLPVSRAWEQVREPVLPAAQPAVVPSAPTVPVPSVPRGAPAVPDELVQQLVQAALVQAGAALEQQLAGRLTALVQAHVSQLLPHLQKEIETAVWDSLGKTLERPAPPRQ